MLMQERELAADLMKRLEQRTAERDEALAAIATAEGRVRVSSSVIHVCGVPMA